MRMCIRNTLQRMSLFVAQRKMPNANKIHLSVQVNTDGVHLFKSSKIETWPVYFTINEHKEKVLIDVRFHCS